MRIPLDRCAPSRIRNDEEGAVAVIFALLITALFGMAALALDMVRAHNVSGKVSTALDAAAVAGAKLLDSGASDTVIKDHAEQFFNSHMKSLNVHDTEMREFATDIDRNKSTVTTRVDVTMGTTFARMIGRNAMTMNKSATVNYRMVNVELALALDTTGSMNQNGKLSDLQGAARDAIDIMLENATTEDAVRISIVPWSASVNAGALSSAVSANTSTDGCVVERINSNAATDAAPTGSDALRTTNAAVSQSYSCPPDSVLPLSGKSRRNDLKDKVQALTANGGTAGHIGTAWGWYMVAPTWASLLPTSARPAEYDKTKTLKSVLLMSDGEFNVSHVNPGPYSAAQVDESYQQFRALCSAMKDKDVVVYAVGFDISAGSRADTELQACASSPTHYFLAANGNQLKNAFRTIANQIMSLRITR